MLLALAKYRDSSEATRTPAQWPQQIDTHAAPSSTNQLHVFIYKILRTLVKGTEPGKKL